MIKIIAIGKRHESWVREGIETYSKRLRAPWNIEWILLPHSSSQGAIARQNESQAILHTLKPDEYVILLDEKGQQLTSPALLRQFQSLFISSKQVVIVIGGAYGVSLPLQERANTVWSLSALVFPHQLVRLLLVEQLYRMQQIAQGGKYHHE